MSNETETPRAKWRELGPDEVIQEGDEYCSQSYVKWRPVDDDLHNTMRKQWAWNWYSFRTRRPLPEVASTNADNSSMTTITDTPRTYAALVNHMPKCSEWLQHYLNLTILCRKLERELNDSRDDLMRTQIEMQLEIDRGEAEVAFWKAKASEAEDREGKLESEVERLREQLYECLSYVSHDPIGALSSTAKQLQRAILATLNPTDK